MPTVHVPAAMRKLTGGEPKVEAAGETLGELIEDLEAHYPGIRARMVDGERLRAGLAAFVDGTQASGLRTRVAPESEVTFAPAIAGG